MEILAIVALLTASNPQETISVHFGSIYAETEMKITLPERDMQDVSANDLEDANVLVVATITPNNPVKYVLVGDTDSIGAFARNNIRLGRYHEILKEMKGKS